MFKINYFLIVIKACIFISTGQESSEENLPSFEFNSLGQSSVGEICDGRFTICEDVNAVCEKTSSSIFFHYCKCREEFIYDRRYKKCIRIIAISQFCSNSRQCQASDRNSFCDYGQLLKNHEPICACRSNYFYSYANSKCVKCKQSSSNCPFYNRKLYHTSHIYNIGFLSKIFLTSLGLLFSVVFVFCFFTQLFSKIKSFYQKIFKKNNSPSNHSTTQTNISHPKQRQSHHYYQDKPPSYEEVIRAEYFTPHVVVSIKTDTCTPKIPV